MPGANDCDRASRYVMKNQAGGRHTLLIGVCLLPVRLWNCDSESQHYVFLGSYSPEIDDGISHSSERSVDANPGLFRYFFER